LLLVTEHAGVFAPRLWPVIIGDYKDHRVNGRTCPASSA